MTNGRAGEGGVGVPLNATVGVIVSTTLPEAGVLQGRMAQSGFVASGALPSADSADSEIGQGAEAAR